MSIGSYVSTYGIVQFGPKLGVNKFTILSIPFLCPRYYNISDLSIAVEKITFKEIRHFNALLIWPRRTCSTRIPCPGSHEFTILLFMLIT